MTKKLIAVKVPFPLKVKINIYCNKMGNRKSNLAVINNYQQLRRL